MDRTRFRRETNPTDTREIAADVTDSDLAQTDAARLLVELVQCPSVTPEDAGALDVLDRYLGARGFTCSRLTFEGDGSYPVQNLFATRGTKGRHLLFAGHTDVVPPGDPTDWTHQPFSGTIENGLLHGRGAVDMKSGVAAFCAAVDRAIANGTADEGILSLAITGDEEADAVNGTQKLMAWAAEKGHAFDFAIVGEPSSAQKVGDRLKTGRRGSFDGRVVVHGMQGHAAYPEKARNPLPVLARIALALNGTSLDDGNASFQPSNLEITSIDTGNPATNVIPARGELRFNVRFNDFWTGETLQDWVLDTIATIDPQGCEVRFERPAPVAESFVCPPADAVALLDTVIADRTGTTPEHSTNGGTSDARFIAQYCPVVECGLVGEFMHQTDERVPLADVESLTQIYAEFISRYLRDA